jgi:biopolymer transport protein ExbD
MAPSNANALDITDDDRQRMRFRKAKARKKRMEREAEGEIKELNITAMMDMMTIILVFLLKSYSTSSLNVDMSDNLKIPQSTTIEKPQDIIKVTVSLKEVTVNDKAAVPIRDGLIPLAAKDGKADNFYVGALYDSLKKEVDKQKKIAQYNEQARRVSGRVNIVADRRIPYRTLIDVLYTAGQAELGEYQFMVLRSD